MKFVEKYLLKILNLLVLKERLEKELIKLGEIKNENKEKNIIN